MEVRFIINRFLNNENKTLGDLLVLRENRLVMMIKTLELPWKNNEKYVSCIPEGVYDIIYPYSGTKYKDVFLIDQVPNRIGILIHAGNYTTQIEGCILPGVIHNDINSDGIMDVKYSRTALESLKHYVSPEDNLKLIIRSI